MSAFVAISAHEKLNGLVDGILEYRPLNPHVPTFISIGKIKSQSDGLYYEFSSKSLSKNIHEKEKLGDLLRNQISHLRTDASWTGELKIFLLENPMTSDENESAKWIYAELCDIYRKEFDVNIQLIRICFSYDVEQPENVSLQIPPEYIRERKVMLDDNISLVQKLLLIDNQDVYTAALCEDKVSHDLMIPRMLVDFMMLACSTDSTYDVMNAIQSDTNIFSLGYAECFYFYEDVKRYLKLANERDLISYMLCNEVDPNERSLDLDKKPLGLDERQCKLENVYKEISFLEDIELFPNAIDKLIDDILRRYKPQIEKCRKEAIETARRKDCENDNLPTGSLEHPEMGIEEKRARETYPEYIDRHEIYSQSLLLDEEEQKDFVEKQKARYEAVVIFVCGKIFKQYLIDVNDTAVPIEDENSNTIPTKQRKNNWWHRLLRLFCKTKEITPPSVTIPVPLSRKELLSPIREVTNMQENRHEYFKFKADVQKMRELLKGKNEEIERFTLTSHCRTTGLLIDLSKLKLHQEANKAKHLENVLNEWKTREEQDRTKSALEAIQIEHSNREALSYQYIDWEKPFDFIDEKDLRIICNKLQSSSCPFINYNVIRESNDISTYVHFYSDNSDYVELLSNKTVDVNNANGIVPAKSSHIASKLCMFQILNIDEQAWNGIVDLREKHPFHDE